MNSLDGMFQDYNRIMKEAFQRVKENAIECSSCGRKPFLRDTPTLEGRSMHYLICPCGKEGIKAYDGISLSKDFVDQAIYGWNHREDLLKKGIISLSMNK
jgi:hypothetical protein